MRRVTIMAANYRLVSGGRNRQIDTERISHGGSWVRVCELRTMSAASAYSDDVTV